MDNEGRLTLEEAMAYTKLTRRKLLQLVNKDEIPHHRISRKVVLFDKKAIDEFLDPLKQSPSTETKVEEKVGEDSKDDKDRIILSENKTLAREVIVAENKLFWKEEQRKLADAKRADELKISLEEAEAFKRQTLVGVEALAKERQEFEREEEGKTTRIRELNDIIIALKAEIGEKGEAIDELTDLLGGEKVAKRKLTAKERAEAKAEAIRQRQEADAEAIRQRQEADAEDYPYLDAIPKGIKLLTKLADRVKVYGYNGVSLSRFLNKWIGNLQYYATYKTEEGKDRARGNYDWAMDTFKVCSEVIMEIGGRYNYYSSVDKGIWQTIFGSKDNKGYDDGLVRDWLVSYDDSLCKIMGMKDGRQNKPPSGYRVEPPMTPYA